MERAPVGKIYGEDEVRERLAAELPHWYFEDGWIRRKYRTSGWKATLMVVNTVGHLAEAAWHHPDLTVSYAFVIVKLVSHDAKGVTDRDFALAAKIESVVQWQPALQAIAQAPDLEEVILSGGDPLMRSDDWLAELLAQLEAIPHVRRLRIHTRLPAAYLTGEAWLQGVPFHVDERVIVPRSLIAEPLADGTLDAWLSSRTQRVLDLCTGSGALAVLAAIAWPDVAVDATDLSADALAVAALNVARHRLGPRITLR